MVIAACLAGGFSCRVTLWDTVTITLSRVLKAVLPLEIFANMDRKNQAAVELLMLASAERRGDWRAAQAGERRTAWRSYSPSR